MQSRSTPSRHRADALRAEHAAQLRVCEGNRRLAAAVVCTTIVLAYGFPDATLLVFFDLLALFVAWFFAAGQHARLHVLASAHRAAMADLPAEVVLRPWLIGLSLSVRHGYLVLFASFDVAWLLHAALRPTPITSMGAALDRLGVGPLPGTAFIAFTVGLWVAIAALNVLGGFVARDGAVVATPRRVRFSLPVTTRSGEVIRLNGYRLARPGVQPVILWPGFFQNGFIFDLLPGEASLAEFLWDQELDVWIVHPRGSGGSGGRRLRTSLDDFAACDLPAVISFVCERVSQRPILVGHSQGGITAVQSMMGATFDHHGALHLCDLASARRQDALAGLVTIGAFPSFAVERDGDLQRMVRKGIPLFGWRLPIPPLLRPLRRWLSFLPLPVDLTLRRALCESITLRLLLLPLFLLLEAAGRVGAWEFLYHLPNVTTRARRQLFLATIDGTFTDILEQFYRSVLQQRSRSLDGRIDYSAHYRRLRLPLSNLAMELDGFVDAAMVLRQMVDGSSSTFKRNAYLLRLGHEDLFMAPGYFPLVADAILALRSGASLTGRAEVS